MFWIRAVISYVRLLKYLPPKITIAEWDQKLTFQDHKEKGRFSLLSKLPLLFSIATLLSTNRHRLISGAIQSPPRHFWSRGVKGCAWFVLKFWQFWPKMVAIWITLIEPWNIRSTSHFMRRSFPKFGAHKVQGRAALFEFMVENSDPMNDAGFVLEDTVIFKFYIAFLLEIWSYKKLRPEPLISNFGLKMVSLNLIRWNLLPILCLELRSFSR